MIAESFSLLPIPLSIPFALSNHHICPLIDLVILNDSNDLFCEFAKFKSLSHATTYTYCNICKACCRYTSIDTYVVCYWRKMLNACAVPCFGRDMTNFVQKQQIHRCWSLTYLFNTLGARRVFMFSTIGPRN